MDPRNIDYATLPLEQFTVTDLTDAIGVGRAADLLNTTKRTIYTCRNTNAMSIERRMQLIAEVQRDEQTNRMRLVVTRAQERIRQDQRNEQTV